MRRLRFTIAYDGTAYHGWQVQPGLPTIQGAMEAALGEIEGKAVHVTGSGRTDAGVHALAQVAACDLENPIPAGNLRRAVNRLLPRDVRVMSVSEADSGFHPRYDAKSKRYEYRIWRAETCPPFKRLYVHHFPYPLDAARLIALAPVFEGEHDFTNFAASDETDVLGRSKVRTVFESSLVQSGNLMVYQVTGSGFLKHMVRNMVGSLIEAGKGNLDEGRLRKLLDQPGVCKGGPTAPARGLFLVNVGY